jgi:hypothetical protein
VSVVAAVARDLAKLPDDLGESTLAAAALALAEELDRSNSATSKSMCAKELRETMAVLRALAPSKKEQDAIDDLTARRTARRAAARVAAATHQSGS